MEETKQVISDRNIHTITKQINTLLEKGRVNFSGYRKDGTLQKSTSYANMKLVAKTEGNCISRRAGNHAHESLTHRGAFAHIGDEVIFSENKVTCIHGENNTNMSGVRKKTVLEIVS